MLGNRLTTIILVLAFVAFTLGGNLLGLYMDWLWFTEIGQQGVFLTVLSSKLKMGLGIGIVSFLFIYLNLQYALRYRAANQSPLLFQMAGIPNLEQILPRLGSIGAAIALFLALSYGLWAAAQWKNVLLYFGEVPFNRVDPLLGLDLGYYVFQLPFLLDIQGWLFTTVGLSAAILIPTYFLKGGFTIAPRGLFMDRVPKVHLSILVGLLLMLLAWDYFLQQYQILLGQRGVVFGATNSDVGAKLPALRVMAILAATSGLFIAAASFRAGWKAQIGAAVLVAVGHFAGVSLIPDLYHKFKVVPNEIAAEHPYIKDNIEATRFAYGLDKIEVKDFPAEDNLTLEEINRNRLAIKNIRLWDHQPLLTTYRQLQQIRTYYDFVDVDNDRYTVDGEYRQVMLSPRELSYNNLPSRIWINEHLTYTHGYGVAIGPVNRISKEGLPEFIIKDIPPQSSSESLQVKRPEIYFGEIPNEYVFVKTKAKEFDYPSGDQNVYTEYAGSGGVPVGSIFRKILMAAHFGALKILLSDDITSESRIIYQRNIIERVSKAAPFLRVDRDPHMVIAGEGRLFWIVDAYTTTDMFPYSQPVRGLGNYIRNSVKVVIDAYNGSMDFYLVDSADPLIRAYAAAFPTLFKPMEEMPEDIRSHIRYPQDLFNLQAYMYATYHMEDPQIFYNKEDLWAIPKRSSGQRDTDMEPYYSVMRLPGDSNSRDEFLLMLPFTPAKRDNMAALMAARCDDPNYGQIVVYTMPKQKLVYGPRQIDARIDQDADISQQLTLWSQRGSQVIRGSLLVIPIEGSLLYVEPLYLAAESGSLPELRRVVVSYGNRLVMEETLEKALESLFGGGGRRPIALGDAAAPTAVPTSRSLKDLAKAAQDHYNSAVQAQRQGEWSRYGEELKRLESIIKEMSTK